MDKQVEKSIGQLMEEEALAEYRRAGVDMKVVVSELYSDGSVRVLYETKNYEEEAKDD